METKKLKNYDMNRIISRVKKEFGTITHGTEENYNPGLDYLEHAIYQAYTEIPITDIQLKEVIEMILYDLQGLIQNKIYDYKEIREEKQIQFAQKIELFFNPFINEYIKQNLKDIDTHNNDELKKLFTFPIKCLLRIYDSIEFWAKRKGKNGYYRMLEEMVCSTMQIGNHPFTLEDKYMKENTNFNFEYAPNLSLLDMIK